ncbi:MAG: hypothetical protein Q9205_006708, partial [Flavoplaca limonia]
MATVNSTPSSTPTIKRSTSEMGSDHESHADVLASSERFASPLIDVYVGEHKYHYTLHSAFLSQSRELTNLHKITAKKSKKGTTLNLPRENPKEIGQVIEFMYFNQVTLVAIEPEAQLDELLCLWKTATQFSVDGMKRQVVEKLDTLALAEKVLALKFIKVADQMYECDIHDDLRVYFNKAAPAVVRKITSHERRHLDNMIEEGGSFAADLFSAYRRAFEISNEPIKSLADIKSESIANSAKRTGVKAPDVMLIPMTASSGPVDHRTPWEKQNSIPALWTKASEADKLVISMVAAGKEWTTIQNAVRQVTGEKPTMTDLLNRYTHLEANIMRVADDDTNLLVTARSEVETEFKEGSEWPLVAARLIQKGGRGYEPIRLRYHCTALDAAEQAAVAPPMSTALVLATPQPVQVKTEVVGGVRVDNTKAINPRKRRRPGTANSARSSPATTVRRPAQARKRGKPAQQAATLQDVSSNEDDNLMLAESSTHRLMPTRSKKALMDRQLNENGHGDGSDGSAATGTMGGSTHTTRGSSIAERESSQVERIAVHDSDEED